MVWPWGDGHLFWNPGLTPGASWTPRSLRIFSTPGLRRGSVNPSPRNQVRMVLVLGGDVSHLVREVGVVKGSDVGAPGPLQLTEDPPIREIGRHTLRHANEVAHHGVWSKTQDEVDVVREHRHPQYPHP